MEINLKQHIRRAKLPNRKETIILALFAALMLISKEALAALPNIEVVSLLIILLTHRVGLKSLWSVYTFVAVQFLIYPSGIWMAAYTYVWAILVFAVVALRRFAGVAVYTIVAGIYGILFGVLCSVPAFLVGGFGYGISWIATGLTYDVFHCIGNILTTALLFYPLDKALASALKRK